MSISRILPLVLLPALAYSGVAAAPRAARAREPLVIEVTGDRMAATPLRVVSSGGRLTAKGVTHVMAADTVHATGPVTLTTEELVGVATFFSDSASDFLRVVVRQGANEVLSARGDMIIVIHTPQGPQIQAMSAPTELRARR